MPRKNLRRWGNSRKPSRYDGGHAPSLIYRIGWTTTNDAASPHESVIRLALVYSGNAKLYNTLPAVSATY